ncbi:MAG TPA: hypothetical protein VFS89_06140 [Nitrosospira sp.]|nr:hypothetical protein [Nitrosospira sp.]
MSSMTGGPVRRLAIEKAKWEGGRRMQATTLRQGIHSCALRQKRRKFSQTRSRFDAIISKKQTVALSALLLYWISIARIPW